MYLNQSKHKQNDEVEGTRILEKCDFVILISVG